MKMKYILTGALGLLLASSAFADKFPSQQSSVKDLLWGKYDVAYPAEFRMIISDKSVSYDAFTKFKSEYGSVIVHPESTITPGTPVKYHVQVLPDTYKLIDMQVISDQEYQTLNQKSRD